MGNFKVGDRVTNPTYGGGTIIFSNGPESVLVEYDQPMGGHSGRGRGKEGHCRYHYPEDLALVPLWRLTIAPDASDPDKTVAVLYENGTEKRRESVRRYYKDEYRAQEAINAVVAKLNGTAREVKRAANVGEWIKIVEAGGARGCYVNGEVYQVIRTAQCGDVYIQTPQPMFGGGGSDPRTYVNESEYVVLEGYAPPVPDPIMIGGKELKAGCRVTLKPRKEKYCDCISENTWNEFYHRLNKVVAMVSSGKNSYVTLAYAHATLNFPVEAIDRILELEDI